MTPQLPKWVGARAISRGPTPCLFDRVRVSTGPRAECAVVSAMFKHMFKHALYFNILCSVYFLRLQQAVLLKDSTASITYQLMFCCTLSVKASTSTLHAATHRINLACGDALQSEDGLL